MPRHPFRLVLAIFTLLALAACAALPGRSERQSPPSPGEGNTPRVSSPLGQQCLSELGSSGARFTALSDRDYGGGCTALNTVRLDRLGSDTGQFAITGLGPLTCPAANRLAGWARYGVDRAARQILGSPLARIETMGSYSCRNIAGSTRRSAHARAEALDIGAFVLEDGRRISVENGWSGNREERVFLRTVHRSACKRFGTVLGPDYNAAHEDHLHLEETGGRYCR